MSHARRLRLSLWTPVLLATLLLQGCASQKLKDPATPARDTVAEAITAGDASYARGEFEDALISYVKAGSTQSARPDLLLRIARTQSQLKQNDLAADAYARVLQKQPDNAEASEGLGLILLQRGQRPAASQLLQTALKGNPQSWRAYNGLGVLSDLAGDYPAAAKLYAQANRLNPHQPQVLNNLGYSRYLAGDYGQALGYFRSALNSAPDDPKAWSNLGLLYARQSQYPQAIAAFSQIMSPAQAHYSTAYVCMLAHREQDAARLYQQAIALAPSYYDAAYRGLAHAQRLAAANSVGATP